MHIRISRRTFLKSAALFSTLGVAPRFLLRTATGAATDAPGIPGDRILVVVQLSGGNDGLNTVVPYGDDAYYRARPRLGLPKDRVLPLDDHIGFNSRMSALKGLYDDGRVAVLQNVGYPNPDRSHFRSMEIWHTASGADEYRATGWIGRYFDNCCDGSARPQVGVAVDAERPQAFEGVRGLGIAFDRPDRYGWMPGKGADTEASFRRINAARTASNDTLAFLHHTASNAILSAREVREAAERGGGDFRRPARGIEALQTVAALIRGGLATRIYYVSFGGFDTHANQAGPHDNLLERFSQELARFQQTLRRDGTAPQVLTLVFSEFGRRVTENASGGTDHGTAAPLFLVGDGVRPGLRGTPPDLENLDEGDLRHAIDFRSVYAAVLEDWFHVDSKPVLEGAYPPASVIA